MSLVVETTGASAPQTLEIRNAGGFDPGSLRVWRTDVMEQFIQQRALSAAEGFWSLALEPNTGPDKRRLIVRSSNRDACVS
ncbi:MAG: hypothetical protein WEB53_14900 [Akkermansiaceae bacterium]